MTPKCLKALIFIVTVILLQKECWDLARRGVHPPDEAVVCVCACICLCACGCVELLTLGELRESAAGALHPACVTTLSETWRNWMEFREEQLVRLKAWRD